MLSASRERYIRLANDSVEAGDGESDAVDFRHASVLDTSTTATALTY